MKNTLHVANDHGQEIPNDLPAPNEIDPVLLSRPSVRRGRNEESAPSIADHLIAIAAAHVCEWLRDGAPDKGEAYARVPAPQKKTETPQPSPSTRYTRKRSKDG